ncbi:hypothetical protein GQ600_10293 [Phytophthora cactorum]|nr:hypothetical protein GQ600_10293 [Phytophthora cactorum]
MAFADREPPEPAEGVASTPAYNHSNSPAPSQLNHQ